MNILYTITRCWPAIGGAETHVRQIAGELSERNRVSIAAHTNRQQIDPIEVSTLEAQNGRDEDGPVTIDLIGPTGGFTNRLLLHTAARMYPYPDFRPLGYRCHAAAFAGKLADLIQTRRIDLIHNVLVGTEYLSHLSCQMARRFSIPFVITPLVHEGIWGDGALFFRIYRQADAVIALLDVERQVYLSGGVRPDHVHTVGVSPVIAPDYDAMLFRDKYNLRGAVALFVGRQIQSKGYQSLLEAAPIVWRRHPDTHFVFIGPLEKSSTPMTASPDPRVINLGPVSDEEKTSAMAACDVFCLPSNSEIMPTAILEAWFFGKPVIGGDIPTLRELIQGSGGGLNVSQTPEAIASGLSALLDNPDRAAQMGESGRQRVRRNYSIGAVCNQLETIYQTLCGRTL